MKHFAIVIAAALAVTACESGKADAQNAPPSVATKSSAASKSNESKVREQRRVAVMVTASGYEPGSVEAKAGEPITLVFKRTTDQGCGQQLVFPDRNIRRELPLNQEVEVELTPEKNETIAFTCGMGMYRGSVVASAT